MSLDASGEPLFLHPDLRNCYANARGHAMYIRTTRFQAKKGSIGKFKELAEYARARATTLDGLLSNYIAIDESSGKGLMIGIWESREKLTASLPAVKANWAGVAEHLDGDPVFDEYSNVVQVKG